ncbi:MAG: TolB family protein [Actinomycetota bacterium]
MTNRPDMLDQLTRLFPPPERPFEALLRRRDRKRRNTRIVAGVVGLAIGALGIVVGHSIVSSQETPAHVGPTPSVQQVLVERNGPLTIFGYLGGLVDVPLNGGHARSVLRCTCAWVPDADWSTDGSRLAFSAVCAGNCSDFGDPQHGIHVFDTTTGSDDVIVAGEDVEGVEWSRDGTSIAFVQGGRIFVMDAGGSGKLPLTDAASLTSRPSWSPDGARIVYSRLESSETVEVVSTDGSGEPTRLVTGDRPAWSADGTRIVYLVDCRVWSMAPDGSDPVVIVDLSQLSAHRCSVSGGPVWSPDGRKLALATAGGLFVMDADGSHLRLVRRKLHWLGGGLTWQPTNG